MDLAALIAFAGLIAAQFAAVIAVHALHRDDEAGRAAVASPRHAGVSIRSAEAAEALRRPARASAL